MTEVPGCTQVCNINAYPYQFKISFSIQPKAIFLSLSAMGSNYITAMA